LQNVTVNKIRSVIQAAKTGFWLQQKGFIPEANATCYQDITMFEDDKTYGLSGSTGGTITLPGGTLIVFPLNAFATSAGMLYTGTVYITAHEILTSDSMFSSMIPGGDFIARDVNSELSYLKSFGMAGAKLYDSAGNELKLAAGKTASIRFPVNPSHSANAPGSIQLWHYDETLMMWSEEGIATRNGNYYVGDVSHFSWWNCDLPAAYCNLTMTVKLCEAYANGICITISDGFQTTTGFTASSGVCTGSVPANTVLTVSISINSGAPPDTVFTIGPFTQGSFNIHPVISLTQDNCNSVSGLLKDCSGFPVNGNVTLSQNNQVIATIPTITGGIYSFLNLSPGIYQLYATSGSLSCNASFTIQTGSTNQMISMNLSLCDTNAIHGDMTDCSGNPANGDVRLFQGNVQIAYVTTSGGKYLMPLVPAGQYTIHGSSGVLSGSTTINVPAGANNQNIVVNLQLCDTSGIYGGLSDCAGNMVNGTVILYSGSQQVATTTSSGGFYSFAFIQPGSYYLHASNGIVTDTGMVTLMGSGAGQGTRHDMQLCDTIPTGTSNFNVIFTGSATGLLSYSFNIVKTAYVNAGGIKRLEFTYIDDQTTDSALITIVLPDYIPGTHIWNSFNSYTICNVMYQGSPSVLNSTFGGQNFLITAPGIGGSVQGSFSGPATITYNGTPLPGSMSGSFDALRTH
jgi:hypothetical protein